MVCLRNVFINTLHKGDDDDDDDDDDDNDGDKQYSRHGSTNTAFVECKKQEVIPVIVGQLELSQNNSG